MTLYLGNRFLAGRHFSPLRPDVVIDYDYDLKDKRIHMGDKLTGDKPDFDVEIMVTAVR